MTVRVRIAKTHKSRTAKKKIANTINHLAPTPLVMANQESTSMMNLKSSHFKDTSNIDKNNSKKKSRSSLRW